MHARRLILFAVWVLLSLFGVRPAAAQQVPTRPDSLVREPLDSLVREPLDSLVRVPVCPDSLASTLPPDTIRPLHDAPGPLNYAYIDSLSQRLLAQHRWAVLDSLGRLALAAGTDYPALRHRLGYAAAMRGQTSRAIRQYERALRDNRADALSRVGLALAYRELGQREAAGWYAAPLPDSVRQGLHLAPRVLTRFEAEMGAQWPSSPDRGTAGFGRVGVGSQLGRGITLWQAVSYYGQQVRIAVPEAEPPFPPPPFPYRPLPRWVPARQLDYQALLGVPLPAHLQARLGYHFVHSRSAEARYPGHLTYAALRYLRPYWQLQAGLYAGRLTDTARTQTELQLTVYPLGNLRLYGFGKAAFVHSGGHTYPHTLVGAGARLLPRVWAEAYAGWGRVPVLADQDGAYVYNLLDPLRRRLGLGLLVPLPGGHWLARLYYGAEARTQIQTLTFYTQYTLTAAATWTW